MDYENFGGAPAKRSLARRAGVALACFLAAMLALTYLSRALSESLKAEVETGYCGTAAIDESLEGTGVWAVGETQLYTVGYSRRITRVYAAPGQRVEPGDALFAYELSPWEGGRWVSDSTLRAARRALEKAQAAQARSEDPASAQGAVDNAQQALRYAEFAYEQARAIQNGGVVCATFSGVLVKCDLAAGKSAVAGTSGFEVAPEGLAFSLTVTEKEAERLAVGDAVTLYRDGQAEPETLTAAKLLPPDAEGRVTVVCAGDGGRERLLGARQDWRVEKQSPRYRSCIPLSALRQSGSEQYYVLILTEKDTILGTQLTVRQEAVTLLARDERRAAIEGSVSEADRLVTASSKELKDGDYVVTPDA